ncbi:hypothetical protein JS55_04990 [Rickettsia felis str. LSU]|nr:hypothetical protein JS55_04990 [Rickettsia felis str. LSU]
MRGAKRRGNPEKIIKKNSDLQNFLLDCFVELLCNSSRNDEKPIHATTLAYNDDLGIHVGNASWDSKQWYDIE